MSISAHHPDPRLTAVPQAEEQQSRGHSIHFRIVASLIAVASCFRVFVCFDHNPMDYLVSDMSRHWSNGVRFPQGGYTGGADPIAYQVYVSAVHHLTRDNRLLVALAAALLSVLMPWTYYRASRNFGLSKISSLWVWALIGWAPSLSVIYHFIMPETLLLFLEGAALWMTARYLRKGGTEAFVVLVFFWTVASLTKPTLIPLAGICTLWACWKRIPSLRQIAIGATLALALLLPQAIRSSLAIGFVAPFGNPWMTRIMLQSDAKLVILDFYGHYQARTHFRFPDKHYEMEFGSPSFYMRSLEPVSHWAPRRAWTSTKATIVIDSADGENAWKEAYHRFDSGWDTWLQHWRENIVLFFFAQSWPESPTGEWDGHLEYRSRWLWAPLVFLVFVLNIREFTHRRFDLIPVATTLYTLCIALQNTIIMEGRYRKPVEVLLLVNLVWLFGRRTTPLHQSDSVSATSP